MAGRGFFITLEGIDFSGKSTQADMLAKHLDESDCDPLLLREPGGTNLSERVREILLNRGEIDIVDRAELMLFLAARAQLVDEIILPAIDSGRIVICDRFYDSTLAYQGYARGLSIQMVADMNGFATSHLAPDLTLLYDLSVETAQRRGSGFIPSHDRLEQEKAEFHQRVRDGYLELARQEPNRIKVINADDTPDAIRERTLETVKQSLTERGIDIKCN